MCGVLRAPHHLLLLQRYATNTVSSYFVRCIRTYHLSRVAFHSSHYTLHMPPPYSLLTQGCR